MTRESASSELRSSYLSQGILSQTAKASITTGGSDRSATGWPVEATGPIRRLKSRARVPRRPSRFFESTSARTVGVKRTRIGPTESTSLHGRSISGLPSRMIFVSKKTYVLNAACALRREETLKSRLAVSNQLILISVALVLAVPSWLAALGYAN